jgi:hypothetical protein
MSRRRKDEKSDEASDSGTSTENEGGERRRRRRPARLGRDDADPVRIHEEYVERHLGGGGPATNEAYEEAVQQWHKLPGAVTRPPAEVPREPGRPGEDPGDEQEGEGRGAEPQP